MPTIIVSSPPTHALLVQNYKRSSSNSGGETPRSSLSSANYLQARLAGILTEQHPIGGRRRKRGMGRRRSSVRHIQTELLKQPQRGRQRRPSHAMQRMKASTVAEDDIFSEKAVAPFSPRFSPGRLGESASFKKRRAEMFGSTASSKTSSKSKVSFSSFKSSAASASLLLSSTVGGEGARQLEDSGGGGAATPTTKKPSRTGRTVRAAARRMASGLSSVAEAGEQLLSRRAQKKAAAAEEAKLAVEAAMRERAKRERLRLRLAALHPPQRILPMRRDSYGMTTTTSTSTASMASSSSSSSCAAPAPTPETAGALPLQRFRSTIFGDRSQTLHRFDRRRVARNFAAGLIEDGLPEPKTFVQTAPAMRGQATKMDWTQSASARSSDGTKAKVARSLSPRSKRRAAAEEKARPFAVRSVRASDPLETRTKWRPDPYVAIETKLARESNVREARIICRDAARPVLRGSVSRVHYRTETPLF